MLIVFVGGVVVFFVGSRTPALVGGLVALLAVAFVVADQLPAGVGGGWVIGQGAVQGVRCLRASPSTSSAQTPSDDLWREEQRRYREKEASGE